MEDGFTVPPIVWWKLVEIYFASWQGTIMAIGQLEKLKKNRTGNYGSNRTVLTHRNFTYQAYKPKAVS